MTVSRRTFLESSLAMFGMALLPFRIKPAQATSVKDIVAKGAYELEPTEFEVKETLKIEDPVLNHYRLPSGVKCYLGIAGEKTKVNASLVEINFPIDPKMLSRSPTTILIENLWGVVSDVEPITSLCNIEHQKDLIFAFTSEVHPLHIRKENGPRAYVPGVPDEVIPVIGFRFERPIITSIGTFSATPKTKIDAYGINNGEDIIVPDDARQATVRRLTFTCATAPHRLSAEEVEAFYKSRPMTPSSYNYEALEAEYRKRRARQTPEENKAEDERVRQYANGNIDLSAWERAAGQLKDFDPQKFARKKIASPEELL